MAKKLNRQSKTTGLATEGISAKNLLTSRFKKEDITDEDVRQLAEEAGFSKRDINRAVKGYKNFTSLPENTDIIYNPTGSRFNVVAPSETDAGITPRVYSGKRAGMREGMSPANLLGLGRNVNYFAGAVSKLVGKEKPATVESKTEEKKQEVQETPKISTETNISTETKSEEKPKETLQSNTKVTSTDVSSAKKSVKNVPTKDDFRFYNIKPKEIKPVNLLSSTKENSEFDFDKYFKKESGYGYLPGSTFAHGTELFGMREITAINDYNKMKSLYNSQAKEKNRSLTKSEVEDIVKSVKNERQQQNLSSAFEPITYMLGGLGLKGTAAIGKGIYESAKKIPYLKSAYRYGKSAYDKAMSYFTKTPKVNRQGGKISPSELMTLPKGQSGLKFNRKTKGTDVDNEESNLKMEKAVGVLGDVAKYALPFIGEARGRRALKQLKPIPTRKIELAKGVVQDLPISYQPILNNPAYAGSDLTSSQAIRLATNALNRDMAFRQRLANEQSKMAQRQNILGITNQEQQINAELQQRADLANAQQNAQIASLKYQSISEPFVAAQQHLASDIYSNKMIKSQEKIAREENMLKYPEAYGAEPIRDETGKITGYNYPEEYKEVLRGRGMGAPVQKKYGGVMKVKARNLFKRK